MYVWTYDSIRSTDSTNTKTAVFVEDREPDSGLHCCHSDVEDHVTSTTTPSLEQYDKNQVTL